MRKLSLIHIFIERQKSFHMEDRALLHRIDYEKGTILLGGKEYRLLDTNFPTIDPKDPYALSAEEEEIMERLEKGFQNCGKLQQHMHFLLAKGGLYKVYNDNLLYHGCIPPVSYTHLHKPLKNICLYYENIITWNNTNV